MYKGEFSMENNQNVTANQNFKTDRSMVAFFLLSFITLGIYGIYFMTKMTNDLNTIASRRDGKKTMHYCLMVFIFSWLTLGIYPIVWMHKMSQRVGDEARARGIQSDFGASTFWLWNVLGSCIVVGPFVYFNKLCKTMNAICEDANAKGC